MNKNLPKLAQALSLKQSDNTVWGKTHDTFFRTYYSNENNASGYFLEFAFNKPQPHLIERLVEHPKLKEYKLNPKFFGFIPAPSSSPHIYRLRYNKLIVMFKDKSLEQIPTILEVVQELVPAADRDALQVCEGTSGQTCINKSDRARLINGAMLFMCPTCVEKVKHESFLAQRKLEVLSPNYFLGSILGFVSALVVSAVWLAAIIFAHRDFLLLAIFSGIACGTAYRFGAKKVDTLGQGLIFTLTLVAFFIVNVLEIAYELKQETGVFDLVQTASLYFSSFVNKPLDAFGDYLFPLIGTVCTIFIFKKDSAKVVVEE